METQFRGTRTAKVQGRGKVRKTGFQELLELHGKQQVPSPRLIKPDLPEELIQLIETTTQFEPGKRFPDMKGAIKLLDEFLGDTISRAQDKIKEAVLTVLSLESTPEMNSFINEVTALAEQLGIKLKVAKVTIQQFLI